MDTLHEERIYLVGFSFIRVIDHTLVLHGGRPLGLVGPSRGWKSSMKIQMGRCPARGLLSSAFLLPLGLLESSARRLGRDVPSPGPSSTRRTRWGVGPGLCLSAPLVSLPVVAAPAATPRRRERKGGVRHRKRKPQEPSTKPRRSGCGAAC